MPEDSRTEYEGSLEPKVPLKLSEVLWSYQHLDFRFLASRTVGE